MWSEDLRAVVRELIETVILALLIFLALQFSVQNFLVQGPSMRPTLDQGQHLLVNKLVYFRLDRDMMSSLLPFVDSIGKEAVFPFHPPRRGEVIIFRFPRDESRDFVKRVIGVSGDTIVIREGTVFVNGKVQDEPYVTRPDNTNMGPLTVPPDSYFVMGDNRRDSHDSRSWGSVPTENVIGRAWVRYWPLDRLHVLSVFGGP